ncbi:hypothetical protein HZH66_007789 [Vespula vulgaris]|uniref:Uncharacterized protein n=1 Tax=Vespula vulgaris TaxID=7454 RepID=A0A834JUV8_VESVU|nr:hypothetical protein HZH66_007789 [Vespula vulgaris]
MPLFVRRQHGKGELLSVGYSDIIKSSFRRTKLQRIRLGIFLLFVHVREQGFSSIRIFQLFDENKTRQPLFPSIFAEDENVKVNKDSSPFDSTCYPNLEIIGKCGLCQVSLGLCQSL